MIWKKWPARLEATLRACERHGGTTEPMLISGPASQHQIEEVEQELGCRLDGNLTQVLLEFAAEVDIRWCLPEGMRPPAPFREIRCGEMSWSLRKIADAEKNRRGWLKGTFARPEDGVHTHWEETFGVMEIRNGDMIGVDLRGRSECPVVYLDHEIMTGPAWRLGNNYIDFIDRWTRLGCPGPEGWQMIRFLPSAVTGLEPDGENARKWRDWFGLEM